MAESDEFDKSELPTQRRREEARAEGRFAYSHELVNGVLLFAGTMGVSWIAHGLTQGMVRDFNVQFGRIPRDLDVDSFPSLIAPVFGESLQLTSWFLSGLFVVGLAVNLAQSGLQFNFDSLGPKWERLNPAENWGKIISWQGTIRGGVSILKVVVLAVVCWWVLSGSGPQIASLAAGLLGRSVSTAWNLAIELVIDIAAVLMVMGVADYGYQWYRNEQQLRMTREEMKEERRDSEGDPHVIARRRQRAREIASQRRMLQDVSQATLVITNPTHLAVALRYRRGIDPAPVVIAKGRDGFAFQIAAKARRHGIPVIQRKPVAQALYKTVKVGQEIPQALFVAVSEVLAYIYRLRGTTA